MDITQQCLDRFWPKVKIGNSGDCWEWQASCDKKWGYGWFRLNGKMVKAHRVSWTIHHGAIPGDKLICHHCDNPRCVNPKHLYLGTHMTNTHDKIKRNRLHSFVGELNPRAKLTEEDIRDIRSSTLTAPALAAKYNTSPAYIYIIRYRKCWKHI